MCGWRRAGSRGGPLGRFRPGPTAAGPLRRPGPAAGCGAGAWMSRVGKTIRVFGTFINKYQVHRKTA
eukprot:7810784-Lingulodinium_polyedra.AAC.1